MKALILALLFSCCVLAAEPPMPKPLSVEEIKKLSNEEILKLGSERTKHLTPQEITEINNLLGTDRGKQRFTAPTEIKIDHDVILMVTHASRSYEPLANSAKANDILIKDAKKEKIPIVYLQTTVNNPGYYCEDKEPTYLSESRGGEFSFNVKKPKTAVVTGGYATLCHKSTIREVLSQWSRRTEHLTVCLPTTAIYDGSEVSDLPKAARDAIVRKHGKVDLPISYYLDEIPKDEDKLDYFKDQIWSYQVKRTHPDAKIVIRFRGKDTVIQEGKGAHPFTLTFQYLYPEKGKEVSLKDCLPEKK